MNKMLSRNPETRPHCLNLKYLQPSTQGGQTSNKRLYGRGEFQSEPTSVLDIRSPSPRSTLSCYFGSSTDGALLRENVCDGQLLDCLGVMDSKDGVGWQNMMGNGNQFQASETENANVNVSMEMEDLENILLESPNNESHNNSQMPCLMEEGGYPMQEIKAEPGLQQADFSETMDTHFSEIMYGNTIGDTIGHPIPPYPMNSSFTNVFTPISALHGPNPTSQFNHDFSPFKIPMDEKQNHLQIPYNAGQTCSERNVPFPMPTVIPQGYVGAIAPHPGFPEIQKSLQWQQSHHQDVQPAWKNLIQRGGRIPLLPTVKTEWSPITIKGKVDSDEVQFTILDQLHHAARFVETGDLANAQAILARLNQQVSPLGRPLKRAAYYFKEALGGLPPLQQSHPNPYLSPIQLFQKISACKIFSENSPILQFANFTANQVLLEALETADKIHVIDFDMGLGGQWASFLQEIALRPGGPPALRLTAVGYGSTEMHLIRESLCSFAEKLNIPFAFQIVEVPQNEYLTLSMLQLKEGETIAVNYSLGMQGFLSKDSVTSLLNLMKQLRPKVVVVVDNENEQNGSSFVQTFINALNFYALLFESIEVVNMNMETTEMIEKFAMAPRIREVVESAYKRQREGEKLQHWRNMFMVAGFTPMMISNFTQKQAECLVYNRNQRFGHCFEVLKKQQEQTLLLGPTDLATAIQMPCPSKEDDQVVQVHQNGGGKFS